jgi:pyruvate dehydrogenase E2 component (dihydrolipoamide acetyltransferase)
MASIIDMPKLSDTMTAGVLLNWLKQEGDTVEPGDAIAEVESDKANMEMEAYDAGVIKKILAQPGDSIEVGKPIAILAEDDDDDISDLLKEIESGGGGSSAAPKEEAPKEESKAAESKPAPAPKAAASVPAPAPAPVAAPATSGGRLTASPLARKMAQNEGLDLSLIAGTGPNGRVIKRDIEKAKADGTGRPQATASAAACSAPAAAPAKKFPTPRAAQIGGGSLGGEITPATQGNYEDKPLSQMRSVIAKRLLESKTTIPHFQVTMDIAMEECERLRGQLKNAGYRVSLNDLVMKGTAIALTKFPMVNASFQGDKIRVYNQIDIGVAVSIEDGLIVPVVRATNLKGLSAISNEVRDLAKRARSRELQPQEFSGATFTISNLGMFGVSDFTAIINPPESAILAVGGVHDVPVVRKGEVVPGRIMKVTLSADHRVIDGAMAAEFLQELKQILENPLTLAL